MESSDERRKQFRLIVKYIRMLCRVSRDYDSQKRPIRSSSLEGVEIVSMMTKLASLITATVLNTGNSGKFEVQRARGQSNLPKVLWLAIVPTGHKVSYHPCVAICFGRKGEGVVVGMLDSVTRPMFQELTRKRTGEAGVINVDGDKSDSRYNDHFLNPLEIRTEDLDAEVLVTHLSQSLELLVHWSGIRNQSHSD